MAHQFNQKGFTKNFLKLMRQMDRLCCDGLNPFVILSQQEDNAAEMLPDGLYVAPGGGEGGGAVDSVFGRTGVVTAANNDYTFAQIGSKPTTLAGYGITDAQPVDILLTGLSAVNTIANQLIYSNGVDTFATTTLSAFARTLLDDADAATMRGTLGVGTGDVTKVGVPLDNQIGVWTGDGTIEGSALFTYSQGLGVEINTNGGAGIHGLRVLNSNVGSNSIIVGFQNALNNASSIFFEYAGSGSTSNKAHYGFQGAASHFFTIQANGNVAVNNSSPTASAQFEVASTTKGFLLPRMTQAQRNLISSPVAGLAVYQTDATPGLRVYNGTNWMRYTETVD